MLATALGRTWAGTRTGLLVPSSTLSLTKSLLNPTFAFNNDGTGPVPESITKIDNRYWAAYAAIDTTHIRVAYRDNDLDGPFTDWGTVLTGGSQAWERDEVYAPWLMIDGATVYLFYSSIDLSPLGSYGAIGVATLPVASFPGTFTKYASNPVVDVGVSGWTSRRVGEQSVIRVHSRWYMAIMAETLDAAYQASEKVGILYSDSGPTGPWQVPATPQIDWGEAGTWNDALTADPSLLYQAPYFWCWATGGRPSPWHAGLWYARDPIAGPWLEVPANPLLSPGTGADFDAGASWRGCAYHEGGRYSVVYGGINGANTAARGGSAILNVS
jgi:hypothetical protein